MSGLAQAGLFLYAKDFDLLTAFYGSVLAMSRLHAVDDMVVLQYQGIQLVTHRIPARIAAGVAIASPPVPHEDAAMKFFFTMPSIDGVRRHAAALGGMILDTIQGPGSRVCNACDPEGHELDTLSCMSR